MINKWHIFDFLPHGQMIKLDIIYCGVDSGLAATVVNLNLFSSRLQPSSGWIRVLMALRYLTLALPPSVLNGPNCGWRSREMALMTPRRGLCGCSDLWFSTSKQCWPLNGVFHFKFLTLAIIHTHNKVVGLICPGKVILKASVKYQVQDTGYRTWNIVPSTFKEVFQDV